MPSSVSLRYMDCFSEPNLGIKYLIFYWLQIQSKMKLLTGRADMNTANYASAKYEPIIQMFQN